MLLALVALMSGSGSDSEQDIPSEFVLQPSAAPSAPSTSADGYDPAAFALGSSSDDEAADATPMRTEQHRDWAGLSRTNRGSYRRAAAARKPGYLWSRVICYGQCQITFRCYL